MHNSANASCRPRGLACTVLLAMRQYDSTSTFTFSTLDAPEVHGSGTSCRQERSLGEVQAYLSLLARGGTPNAGQREAWSEFFRHYSPTIHLAVRKAGVPCHDAGDCVQEIWMKVVGQFAAMKYRPGRGVFTAWLGRVIHSTVIDFLRRRSKDRAVPSELLIHRLPANSPGPAALCERSERRLLLRHLLEHLRESTSPLNCQVVELLHLHNLSVAEVAGQLSISPQQVWYRNHRTLKKLQTILSSHGQFDI